MWTLQVLLLCELSAVWATASSGLPGESDLLNGTHTFLQGYDKQMKEWNILRSEVFTAARMMMIMIWVLTLCRLVGRCQRFGETYCLHLQDHLLPWRWRQYVSPKSCHLPTSLHSAKTQKNDIISEIHCRCITSLSYSETDNSWHICTQSTFNNLKNNIQ
jgi:hypothetical protein